MARGYRRKRSYATPQRILVHLSSPSYPAQVSNLLLLTQEGIADSTFSARTTVTKWLIRLEEQGFIADERQHVPGHRVRKTVYRLTAAGWAEARRIRRRLGTDVVEVRPPGMAPVLMRVAEVPRFFPTLVDLTTTVSLVREGRLDLSDREGTRRPVPPLLLWGDALRTVDRLFGRFEELRVLDDWASSPTSALAVVGAAGIGKSTLVASWVLRRRLRAHVYWMELEEAMTPGSLLADIAGFLGRLGHRGLTSHLSDQGAADLQAAARVLSVELRDLPVLFVLDNFGRAPPETRRFVAGPFLEVARGSPMKAILVDRTLPDLATFGQRERRSSARVLRVGGLDLEASVAFLRAKGLAADDETTARVAASTRGHPLLLALSAQGGTAAKGEVGGYLKREVWRSLSESEQATLEAASVFRCAAPLAALRTLPGVTESSLAGLHRKDLLQPTITEHVVLHDLLRDSVLAKLTPDERLIAHAHAARYFLGRLEAYDRIEGLHHLIRAGEFRQAAQILQAEAVELLDSLSADSLASVLSGFDSSIGEPDVVRVLAEVHGDSLRIAGRLAPAEAQYREALECAERIGDPRSVPRLLRKVAAMARIRNEYPRALELLRDAQARLEAHPDAAELAEVLKETALAEESQGHFEDAVEHLNRAIDLATEASDPASLMRALLVLGTFEGARGDPALGLQHKLEAHRIAERTGNVTEAARACISVGASLWELHRLEESLAYHDRGLQLAMLVGNLRLIAYAHLNRAGVLLDLARPEAIGASLTQARRIFELLEEHDAVAMLDMSEGQHAAMQGRWVEAAEAWERGLKVLRRIGSPKDLLYSLREIGRYHVRQGRGQEARRYLEEALVVARRIGNEAVIREVEGHLASLRRDTGRG